MKDANDLRIILLETSSRVGQVALALGKQLLTSRRLEEARRHARDLVPTLADLLNERDWTPRDIDLTIVNVGPGSYTGLRVGIMSAKTFAYATGCALVGVQSMTAIAQQAPQQAMTLDVFVDAQQDRVYAQRFERNEQTQDLTPLDKLRIIRFADWLTLSSMPEFVSGPGLNGKIDRLPKTVQVVEKQHWLPQPTSLLNLGLHQFAAGDFADVWALEPIYLRPSAAEEQFR